MAGVGRDLCRSSSPTPCRSRVTYSRLHRTLSRRVLNISREGDSTTSLGSLFQCSITLRGKKFFLMFRRNFLCFSLCPLPLVCVKCMYVCVCVWSKGQYIWWVVCHTLTPARNSKASHMHISPWIWFVEVSRRVCPKKHHIFWGWQRPEAAERETEAVNRK